MPISSWNSQALMMEARQRGLKGMQQAADFLKTEAKLLIDRSNRDGNDPSKPGEPPKKVTVRLQKSVVWEAGIEGQVIFGRVGTNVVYGRHLELGTSTSAGSTTAATKRHMAARPWLRPTLRNKGEAAVRVFSRAFLRG